MRVPLPKKGKSDSTRIEFRAPDPACNPYLAFSVMLAAGLKGIDEGYELPPEATDNIYALTDAERLAEGIAALPGSLRDALDAMERSELMAEALGEHVFENFLVNKRREWTDYKAVRHAVRDRSLARNAVGTRNAAMTELERSRPRLSRSAAAAARRARSTSPGSAGRRSPTRRSRCRANRPTAGRARSCAPTTTPKARSRCAASLRKGDARVESILLLVSGAQLHELEHREDLFDDFCLSPFHPKELEARLRHLMFRAGRGDSPELASYGDLVLNFETYQAAIGGKPLDLTYMEYELLKFFVTHPGKVFTREQLLSRVWGYEYYGGARTVDVHVRRLRAKLGEEHANLIQTVRSVGYRFGQTRWPGGSARHATADGLSLGRARASASSTSSQPMSADQIAPTSEQADRPDHEHERSSDEHDADHAPTNRGIDRASTMHGADHRLESNPAPRRDVTGAV